MIALFDKLKILAKHGRSHLTLPLAHGLLRDSAKAFFIVAYPRSGSTWMRTVLCNILVPDAKGDPRVFNEKIPGVSLRRLLLVKRTIKDLHPIIHSHTSFHRKLTKVLYLVRDGRDALVSYYHYTITRNDKHMDFSTWFKLYRWGFYGKHWHTHVESWLINGKSKLGSDLLLLRFEDLKENPIDCIKVASAFFGISASHQEIAQAVQDATLEKGRSWEQTLIGKLKTLDASFYRGGKSKLWPDYFTEKEMAQFMAMSKHAMSLAGYT